MSKILEQIFDKGYAIKDVKLAKGKFKAKVKGIEAGAAEGTKRYKGDLPKATIEKVEKETRRKFKKEAGKKLLKENQ